MRAFSLFSGAGGMDLGFEQAGFIVDFRLDSDRDCCDTLHRNFRCGDTVACADAGGVSFSVEDCDLVRVSGHGDHIFLPRPDVVFGGAPCQAFSVAGRQDPDDPRATLVGQFVRIVSESFPDMFVLENVPALLRSMKPHAVAARDLLFGLPQSRERVFFFGARIPCCIPTISSIMAHSSSPRTAGAVLKEIGAGGRGEVPRTKVVPARNPILRRSPYGGMLFNGRGRPVNRDSASGTLPASMGGNRTPIIDDNELYEGGRAWVADYHSRLMDGAQPAKDAPPCLRRMTAVEAAAFQGFPRDFSFCGKQSSVYRQIGNAVPPPMARAVALAMKAVLEHNGAP